MFQCNRKIKRGNPGRVKIYFTPALFALLFALCSITGLASAAGNRAPTGAASEPVVKQNQKPATIADRFIGEQLVYKISFWFFRNVAEGKVTFKEDGKGGYLAIMDARTTGAVDKIVMRRHDHYVARLALSKDGTRFITRSLFKTVTKNGRVRESRTYVDHENRIVSWINWGDGREEKSDAVGYPEGVYIDDPLGAFYNFRAGAYGPLKLGGEYKITTFPKHEKIPEIILSIATEKEMKRRLRGKKAPAKFLADATIGKDFFGSGNGEIEIYFSDGLVPLYAVAKDVAIFGDVKGRLKEVKRRIKEKPTHKAETETKNSEAKDRE